MAAAAYAALLSLMHTIEQIQHHPRPPISIDMEQYQSLTENITFLQEFLEGYSYGGNNEAATSLERSIAFAAYTTEDIIESQIVDKIRGQRSTVYEKRICCFQLSVTVIKLHQGLGKAIKYMEFLKTEIMKIKEKMEVQDQLQPASSRRFRPTTGKKNIMVSFDDVFIEILDKLTGGRIDRQIIPIVGMGGVGKTTLAQNMYANPLVEQYFDIRAWATISQAYSMREILIEIVGQLNKQDMEKNREMTDNELGEKLRKHLWGRRYLIVMDDMWSIDAWDKVQFFFPECNNGSRIVVTTRLANLASQLTSSGYTLEMRPLDEVKSWNLFCETVFEAEGGCPCELEGIGKEIAKNCKGLPLSIVVIGGLLAKSNHTREYWEYIAGNLILILNEADDERCIKILYMSYNQLPLHMKPCFLYMGVYPEDHAIRVSELTKLWVMEGFVRPISGKCLEEVANECLKELVDRNLIMVDELGSTGNIKRCKIHDLLRVLCLREAYKERFYYFVWKPSVDVPEGMRRYIIPEICPTGNVLAGTLQSSIPQGVRTLIWRNFGSPPLLDFKLLRIFKDDYPYSWVRREFSDLENVLQYVNLRYVKIDVVTHKHFVFPSVSLLWNLHTLIVHGNENMITALGDIWKMPQLRHVEVDSLDLPADDEQGDMVVLYNLQTLGTLSGYNSTQVFKRIPNIKKLKTVHMTDIGENYLRALKSFDENGLRAFELFVEYISGFNSTAENDPSGFDRLQKLESLDYRVLMHKAVHTRFLQRFNFPNSLKKLTLEAYFLQREDLMDKIGSLPLLEKFKGSFKSRTWETVEGQFRSLKFLEIFDDDLESWKTESTHFPCLEHLVLVRLPELKEIPSDIGEIPTLQSITLKYCRDTAVVSAKGILEQQEELGEVGLQVRVRLEEMKEEMQSLASHNFQIESG